MPPKMAALSPKMSALPLKMAAQPPKTEADLRRPCRRALTAICARAGTKIAPISAVDMRKLVPR
eukprot:2399562-Rhodomonas_salina.1